jgi:HKD family nuclease
VDDLGPGLFETLVTEGLRARLTEIDKRLLAKQQPLRSAEAPDRIAWHLSRQIQRALADVSEDDRVAVGVQVARDLLERLGEHVTTDPQELPVDPAQVLSAITAHPAARHHAAHQRARRAQPVDQLRSEIESADEIDVVMAFIRRSGIAPLLDALRRHCADGQPLRVLTTTYTGSTDGRALDQLAELGADVRVSYDLSTTRLHAKAWVFHRHSGFSTAYVGSSNLTHSAQVTGLEWNVRALGRPQPRRARQVRRHLRQLLGRRRLRPLRPRPVRGPNATAPAAPTRAPRHPQPDRADARARSRSGCSSRSRSPASEATTATCSSPPPAPARP